MKIVLAGSPEISIAAFEEVIKNFDVVAIVTQPDRPKGRGMVLTETAVSELGNKHGITVFKPEKIATIAGELKALNYDLFLTFAFGQWVPTSILEQGKFKPVNIHGSLLPKYRGAAPIHHAILNGDAEIGITLIEMIKEMDAGPMYFKASKTITPETNTGDGFKIISDLAKSNIVKWLKVIEAGDDQPEEQSAEFTLAPKIDKSFCELSISESSTNVIKKIKGLSPFPGAFLIIEGKRLKIFDATLEETENAMKIPFDEGPIYIKEYQWENKKRIKI